ncbi:hypothetical protein HPK01_03035 [Anoxybacillus flavithermus]|uniref:hypothetical protein n=1 Tax=Anoxybacillus flavithermus TaxID=33934 RepID=UPI001868B3D5|nr:hypothetical protein [Anoxybacillus flavithermus]MBE2907168.1 hypothetical protein [Anoxybacillus flavithermus]
MEILCSPNTGDIEKWIEDYLICNNSKKNLHIVPTLILYRRRMNFYKKKYIKEKFHGLDMMEIEEKIREKHVGLYEMDKFLQDLVTKSDLKVLSKRESLILIERILSENQYTNNLAWRLSITDLSDCFLILSQTGLTIEQIRTLDQSDSWQLVCNLYKQYTTALSQNKLLDFGQASVQLIEKYDFSDFEMLLLDGAFLPILPKHQILINRFKSLNKPIKCFLPVDLDIEEHPAFEAIKKTYGSFVPISNWQSIKNEKMKLNVSEKLAISIFHSKVKDIDDRSVEILRFTSQEEELDRTVEQAAQLIHQKSIKPEKIAIVTPNPMELRPVVRELSEIYNLKVLVPERPLIQLPHGRAINNLLKIYTDDQIDALGIEHIFDIKMFTDLIHANFFENFTELIRPFEILKAFFEDCKSFSEWYNTLEQMIRAKSQLTGEFLHHPLYHVTEKELLHLKNAVEIIEKVSQELISRDPMTFRDHMHDLISYIQNSPFIGCIDPEIETRLLSIAENLSSDHHLLVSRKEFAKRIHTIMTDKEYEKMDNKDLDKISVTGPNNVEFQEYEYVFLTRFTQNMYPETIKYRWPINLSIERKILNQTTDQRFPNDISLVHYYLDRSIYHFYIALNAAKKKLTISYSKFEDGIELSPSHYLNDIASCFGIEEDSSNSKETIEDLLMRAGFLFEGSKMAQQTNIVTKRVKSEPLSPDTVITIEDIAVYRFCPRRFYYEKTISDEHVYSTIFHLQNFAVSYLYEEAVVKLVEKFPDISVQKLNKIERSLPTLIHEAELKIKPFFPMGQRFWEDVKIRTSTHLSNLIKQILSQTDHKSAKLSLKTQSHTVKIDSYEFRGERQLQVRYGTSTHYYAIKNMRKILSFHTNDHREEQQRLKEIKDDYFNLLSNFCRKEHVAEETLHYYAKKFSTSQFPKNIGAHCNYCAFQKACKEKEIQTNETD